MRFVPAADADFEALLALRIAAMRESLERIGRFDPARARERFAAGFAPEHTRHILVNGERVGFVVVKPQEGALVLDHLYIASGAQGQGIGAAVLLEVFAQADAAGLPVRVGALRDSDSNRFYLRHGFELIERAEFDNYYRRPARIQPRIASGLHRVP
ncbi:GNAT family N-acetyltransferase [Roseateles toxinivorans]|uniref:GNAT family N-acetyltransferase n=1 Tax=Roseateles toxinivorans TaxID=270368 RepID=UPI003C7B6BE6